MANNTGYKTFFHNHPRTSDKGLINNYIIGHELERLTRDVVDSSFGLNCNKHFVTEPGPDVEFSYGAMEVINCKPYLTVSEPRFRRILKNLERKRIKAIVCSYRSILTEEQQKTLKRKKVIIVEVGTQILPSYIWKKYTIEKRLGTKKNSERNLKWVKNRILSGLFKIKELFLIYYLSKTAASKRKITSIVFSYYVLLKSILAIVNKISTCSSSDLIARKWKCKAHVNTLIKFA